MAFKLTSAQIKHKDALTSKLREAQDDLEEELDVYNQALEELKHPVEEAVSRYNKALDEVRDFMESTTQELRGEFEDKSDKWKESDRASNVDNWIETFEAIDFSEVEVDFPEALTLDTDPVPDEVDNLETEPYQG